MTLIPYKAIVLDFDGVVVESNGIKDRAFELLFAEYTEHLSIILEYHRRTSLIRFEKFRYIYEEILRKPYALEVERTLGKQFSNLCVDAVINCPYVNGAENFLKFFGDQVPLYIVSVNPADDLEQILQGRQIRHFFKDVYPVASTKQAALKHIVQREQIGIDQAVFIGDSRGDYESAKLAGINFIGRRGHWDFQGSNVCVFDDLDQIKDYLCRII